MHFSIPDTQEFIDASGNAYVGYNIHINGLFHCTVRYKQLHNLHEQLTRDLDISLPPFPPKKFFPLTVNQQEERRISLEKYIQSIGQHIVVNNSGMLNGFLLNAQQESVGGPSDIENLDIYLTNGCTISVNVSTGDNPGEVLKKVYKHLRLPEQYYSYFALFIVIQDEDNCFYLLRKLQEFESPFITYKNMRTIGSRLVLMKSYWDIEYDLELMKDPVALNLLYIQAISEIQRGWILVPEELKDRLNSLRDSEKRREYLDIARTLRYYGYIQFAPCFCDYPQAESKVLVAIGRNELNVRIFSNEEQHEAAFKVSRMRCWRITTLQNGSDRCEESNEFTLELSFEYLIARNQLQWITIASEQAILMSVCLQSMIDELLLKSVGGSRNKEVTAKSWTYIMRDGQSRIIMGVPNEQTDDNKINSNEQPTKSEPIMKKLAGKLAAVKIKKSEEARTPVRRISMNHTSDYDTMENNAFQMIGDDDL